MSLSVYRVRVCDLTGVFATPSVRAGGATMSSTPPAIIANGGAHLVLVLCVTVVCYVCATPSPSVRAGDATMKSTPPAITEEGGAGSGEAGTSAQAEQQQVSDRWLCVYVCVCMCVCVVCVCVCVRVCVCVCVCLVKSRMACMHYV